ncbi:DUF924 family protein [Parvularcula oceani]|uniref:DUF924 family protein n=1 Tax=Parvularcula oceani TaxID=1247963 RepID=UPI0009DFFA70|nr:DUF924 family protein [Parvularcula oceani]
MKTGPHKEPGPDHPISTQRLAGLANATAPSGRLLAASTNAICLREADLAPVTYFPRRNVDPSALTPTAHETWCPFKGRAAYDAVLDEPDRAWTYYDPFPAVSAIAGHVAFYPDAAETGMEDLPAPAPEAEDVLRFWFDEVPAKKHFAKDEALDRRIAERFGGLQDTAARGRHDEWMRSPTGSLALLILLDQFSRNLHRGSARAFENDEKARHIADHAIGRGFDLAEPPERRAFVYLPFMHSEDLQDQNRSVRLYTERLPGAPNVAFALGHREEIHRHGRFRGRDAALGR